MLFVRTRRNDGQIRDSSGSKTRPDRSECAIEYDVVRCRDSIMKCQLRLLKEVSRYVKDTKVSKNLIK
jgi:hypothetical protein